MIVNNTRCALLLLFICLVIGDAAAAAPSHTLDNNRCSMLAMPTNLTGGNSVNALFGEKLRSVTAELQGYSNDVC